MADSRPTPSLSQILRHVSRDTRVVPDLASPRLRKASAARFPFPKTGVSKEQAQAQAINSPTARDQGVGGTTLERSR